MTLFLAMALLAEPADAGKKRPLVWAESALPTTMDPLHPKSPVDYRVHALIYDHLFYRDGDTWSSHVLDDITVAEDGRLHATVIPQIRWHDGDRLRPADVCHSVDALNHAVDSPFHRNHRSHPVHCEINEAKTGVWISFAERPHPDPRASLSIPLIPASGSGDPVEPQPVGTGPMRARFHNGTWLFEAWSGGSRPSQIPVMRLAVEPSRTEQVRALLDGEVDGVIGVPPAQLPEVRKAGMSLRYYERQSWWYLALDTTKPPLDDPSLRAALDAHLDRRALREKLVTTDPDRDAHPCTLISGPWPPDSARYNRGVMLPQPEPVDPVPLGLRIAVPNTLDLPARRVLDALLAQWSGFGATGSVVSGDADLEDFHVVVGTWTHGDNISPLYHSPSSHRGLANPFGFSDVVVDRLLRDLDDAQTDLETHQLSREIHALLADQRAHLYLWELDWWSAWRPGIEHQVISPGDYFGDLSAWRIP